MLSFEERSWFYYLLGGFLDRRSSDLISLNQEDPILKLEVQDAFEECHQLLSDLIQKLENLPGVLCVSKR